MQTWIRRMALVVLTLVGGCAIAEDGYELTGKPGVNRSDSKVEVVEFFWYGCPHCYEFEPTVEAWAKNKADYIEFRREAPVLNPNWESHSRAFYAAQIMGVGETLHTALFDAIHKERKRLNTPETIADFASELGIDEGKFLSTMRSFVVDGRLAQARRLAIEYGLTGVPTVVVQGKYRTSGSLAGNYKNLIDIVNTLSAKEHGAS